MNRGVKKPKQEWYASGGNIAICGPFANEYEAREAMRLTPEAAAEQRRTHGTSSPFPHDMVVWPEREDRRAGQRQDRRRTR